MVPQVPAAQIGAALLNELLSYRNEFEQEVTEETEMNAFSPLSLLPPVLRIGKSNVLVANVRFNVSAKNARQYGRQRPRVGRETQFVFCPEPFREFGRLSQNRSVFYWVVFAAESIINVSGISGDDPRASLLAGFPDSRPPPSFPLTRELSQ
jgi:hypothetical protein